MATQRVPGAPRRETVKGRSMKRSSMVRPRATRWEGRPRTTASMRVTAPPTSPISPDKFLTISLTFPDVKFPENSRFSKLVEPRKMPFDEIMSDIKRRATKRLRQRSARLNARSHSPRQTDSQSKASERHVYNSGKSEHTLRQLRSRRSCCRKINDKLKYSQTHTK